MSGIYLLELYVFVNRNLKRTFFDNKNLCKMDHKLWFSIKDLSYVTLESSEKLSLILKSSLEEVKQILYVFSSTNVFS